MIRNAILAFVAIGMLTFVMPAPGWADTEVQPSHKDPTLILKAHKPHKGHSASPAHSKKPRPVWNCPGAKPGSMAICTSEDIGIGYFRISNRVEAAIITATRTIGLPSLAINIQPGGATLVNLDTIFYAQPQPFTRTVTLLGYDIDLAATPVLFTWHHGDGTSQTTSKPGAPYPSKSVTYRYQQPADHLSPSVDVTYRVRYRVDGGAWQTLGQTLTANGQAGDLEVKEAGAVLTSY